MNYGTTKFILHRKIHDIMTDDDIAALRTPWNWLNEKMEKSATIKK